MKRKLIKIFLITSQILLFSLYNNCGGKKYYYSENSVLLQNNDLSFFNYNYSSKPNYYSDMSLVRSSSSELKLLGYIIPSHDSTNDYNYNLSITDTQHNSLCQNKTGTLNSQNIIIDYLCILNRPEVTNFIITVDVFDDSISEKFEFNY